MFKWLCRTFPRLRMAGRIRGALVLQQPHVAQFAAHRFGHVLGAGGSAVEVAWRVGGREVAPALERAVGPRLHQHRLAIEHDVAAADAGLVDERADVEDALPAHDLAADHPVERAADDDLVGTLGHHAGGVVALALARARLARRELLLDPVLQVLDGIAADTELDEMQHGGLPRQAVMRWRPRSTSPESCFA